MKSTNFLLAAVVAVCLFYPSPILTAAERTVGEGGSYTTLQALRTATGVNALQNGDTIVLNGSDNSLTAAITTANLTLLGNGSITYNPTSTFRGPFYSNSTANSGIFTLGSNDPDYSGSLEFRNFTSRVIAAYTANILGGTNSFTQNSMSGTGGAINTGAGGVAISGGTNTFTKNSATSYGGVINTTGAVTLAGGTNTFIDNSTTSIGGVIRTSGAVTLSGGTNTFTGNTAGDHGGAIANCGGSTALTISGGTNTFANNRSNVSGGAIHSHDRIILSGGINTFTGNTASSNTGGGAMYAVTVNISGGINEFTGNTATGTSSIGGAIRSTGATSITGGTNTFTGNTASGLGGAIHAGGVLTLRASDGDITFSGNKDGVTAVAGSGKANAIHLSGGATQSLTLAAGGGQNIYFYDPVTSATGVRTISINPLASDTGRVVFDGSDYAGLNANNRRSTVQGNTTVSNGTLALQGDVVYGAANNIGTFTLGKDATLESAFGSNEIWANTITMNGTVDIGSRSSLALSAAQGVTFNGILNLGLGLNDWFDSLLVTGNLTFAKDAVLSVYWDDSLSGLTDAWSREYDLSAMFTTTGNVFGLNNLSFDVSSFDDYKGFSYTLEGGILTLLYESEGNVVPEPATLVMLGLSLAGLGLAARKSRKKEPQV